ncbi:MAG: phosphoenolpyruvate--protein phosphotransferase [Proteobacteria bacterium]|nr:phosphoenolpyruvate--protein phosphotransferase [Pseudomonadota bacterium]
MPGEETKKPLTQLKGMGVSEGVALGPIYLLERERVAVPHSRIPPEGAEAELARFKKALAATQRQLELIKKRIQTEESRDLQYIIDAQVLILKDVLLLQGTEDGIRQGLNAEWALELVRDRIKTVFEHLGDEYFRERRSDVDYAVERLLRSLLKRRVESIEDVKGNMIVASRDLSPADTAQMVHSRVIGFITDMGSKSSHTAIMARSLEIPAVVGLKNVSQLVKTGDVVAIDGFTGEVVINPDAATRQRFAELKKSFRSYQTQLPRYRRLPAVTRDGNPIRLVANIELVEEMGAVKRYGAEGVGLYRTEFLFMNRKDLPTEEEHYQNYRKVAEAVFPQPAVIRTLDIGGDKFVSQLELAPELNPAMGLRAIRFCLKEPKIFKSQLKGILRAGELGNLKIMLPMISGVEEVRAAREIIEEAQAELKKDRARFAAGIPIGIMVETPSAVAAADLLAREVDFFSIGTNDLIQYSLAIDRANAAVSYLYEPLHPGVLRMIRSVADAGRAQQIRVAICGEMAGDPFYTAVLLGLGLEELSMSPYSIPRIKRMIRMIDQGEARNLADRLLGVPTGSEIASLLTKKMEEWFPDFRSDQILYKTSLDDDLMKGGKDAEHDTHLGISSRRTSG